MFLPLMNPFKYAQTNVHLLFGSTALQIFQFHTFKKCETPNSIFTKIFDEPPKMHQLVLGACAAWC